MISTIFHNRDYEKRVAIAISCNGSLGYFGNFARISIKPYFLEDGMYFELTGEKPKMRMVIPNCFDRIEEFVSLTDNIIRNKLAEDLLYQ